ncbi:hypothetical protein IIM_00499 [Bacillus cereus VD107]|nr:hypothetical protein IIM_00499 [Bacillus cereus VD107]
MNKFQNYTHFKNYCFKIMRNNELKITNQINQVFTEFEKVENALSALKEERVIDYTKSSLEYVVKLLQVSNMKTTLNCMKYLTEKVTKMLNGEVNIYYLHTSLNSMLGMETFFPEKYILQRFNSKETTSLYPARIKCIEIVEESETVHSISLTDLDLVGKFGIYFIYDESGEIAYIGKSISCVVSRCFKSVEERALYSFSKIEIRCTKTMSDTNIYEPYYIAKYKPYLNSEFINDDETTIILPELEITKMFGRDASGDSFEFTYCFVKSKTYDIEEAIERYGDTLFFDNRETREIVEKKGLLEKWDARNKAHEKCLRKIKNSGLITIKDIQEEIRLKRKNIEEKQ